MAASPAADVIKAQRAMQQLQRKQEEVERIFTEARHLETDNARLTAENRELAARNLELESTTNALKIEFSSLESQVRRQALKLQEYINRDAEHGGARPLDRERLAHALTERDELRGKLQKEEEAKRRSEDAHRQTKASEQKLHLEVQDLQGKLAQSNKALDELQQQVQRASQREQAAVQTAREVQHKADQFAQNTQSVTYAEREALQQLKEEVLGLTNENHKLIDLLQEERESIRHLRESQGKFDDVVRKQRYLTDGQVRIAKEEIKALSQQNETLLEDVRRLMLERDQTKRKMVELESTLAKYQQQQTPMGKAAPASKSVGFLVTSPSSSSEQQPPHAWKATKEQKSRGTMTAAASSSSPPPAQYLHPHADRHSDDVSVRLLPEDDSFLQRNTPIRNDGGVAAAAHTMTMEAVSEAYRFLRLENERLHGEASQSRVELSLRDATVASLQASLLEKDTQIASMQLLLQQRDATEALLEEKIALLTSEGQHGGGTTMMKGNGAASALETLAKGGLGHLSPNRTAEASTAAPLNDEGRSVGPGKADSATMGASHPQQELQELKQIVGKVLLQAARTLRELQGLRHDAHMQHVVPIVPCEKFRDAVLNRMAEQLGGLRHIMNSIAEHVDEIQRERFEQQQQRHLHHHPNNAQTASSAAVVTPSQLLDHRDRQAQAVPNDEEGELDAWLAAKRREAATPRTTHLATATATTPSSSAAFPLATSPLAQRYQFASSGGVRGASPASSSSPQHQRRRWAMGEESSEYRLGVSLLEVTEALRRSPAPRRGTRYPPGTAYWEQK